MIDDKVKAIVLALIVILGIFTVSQALVAGRVAEPFSELGLLGPKMKIGDYPKTVLVNETFRLYLYLENHEGHIMYYTVYVKLGNNSTFINETQSSNAPIISTYEAILLNGQNTTMPIDLSISTPTVNARLILEMWDFNSTGLKYHGRWLQLWMNITKPE